MLICNNCFHTNDDGVNVCAQCNMRGNFTYRKAGERVSDEIIKKDPGSLCMNCGSDSPGQGSKCLHCNFPLTEGQPEGKQQTHLAHPDPSRLEKSE